MDEFRDALKGQLLTGPEHKVDWVEQQVREVMRGKIDSVVCPYCLSTVVVGVEKLCCDPMGEVTAKVLERMENEGRPDAAPACSGEESASYGAGGVRQKVK